MSHDDSEPNSGSGDAPSVDADLALALRMADLAAEIALRQAREGFTTEIKPDGSPVTSADLEVDAALVAMVAEERPGDAILSEEGGEQGAIDPVGGRRWIIDPIDGTSYYAARKEAWANFIALEQEGTRHVGVVGYPDRHHRFWGATGLGAWSASTDEHGRITGEPERLRLGDASRLADATFTAWPLYPTPLLDHLRMTATFVEPTDKYFGFVDLFEGRFDLVLDQGGQVWDHAAPSAVLTHAGGRFLDPEGGDRVDRLGGIYTNPALAAEIERFLEQSPPDR